MNYSYVKRAGNYPSVINLNPSLTINGTTKTPKFRYKLGDANATNLVPWGYGETLTRVAVATPPTYNAGSPGLGANDDSCKFNASDYYKYTGASNDLTTGDLAFEILFKASLPPSGVTYLTSGYATDGWVLYLSSTGRLYLYINDNAGQVETYAATLIDGAHYHLFGAINRDEASTNGCVLYLNGVASGVAANMSARQNTLASGTFAIGASSAGANNTNSAIAYLAAWESPSWFQAGPAGPAEWATIAAARFASLKAGWDWASLT